MKYIIIILLLFTLNLSGQSDWKNKWLKQDKALHFTTSIALTSLFTETAKDFKFKNPEVVGITVAISAGIFKEFVLDDYPDVYDMTTNIAGCIAGVYVNRLFNKWETKKYFKKK